MMDFHSILFLSVNLMLYVHGKQLRSCWDDQLLNLTVPGQSNRMWLISIKCTFSKVTPLESEEQGNYNSTKECAGREDQSRDCCMRSGHATDQASVQFIIQ